MPRLPWQSLQTSQLAGIFRTGRCHHKSIGGMARVEDLRERIVISRTIGPADFAERYNAWTDGAIGPAHTLRQSAFLRGSNVWRKVDNL